MRGELPLRESNYETLTILAAGPSQVAGPRESLFADSFNFG